MSAKEKIAHRKRMAIIASYFAGESYGLLGPQVAATIIQDNTPYECIVIAVTRDDPKDLVKKALNEYFGNQRPIIGFSSLSGRKDLFSLAKELKDEGATTILGGPQANVDFLGEKDWQTQPHRFKGLSGHFSFAVHGPAEQIIHFLLEPGEEKWKQAPGFLFVGQDGRIMCNPKKAWDKRFFTRVRWDNIFRIDETGLAALRITSGQVLHQIGCPYAARANRVEIEYPVSLAPRSEGKKLKALSRGCSFCDVATDKGFFGALDTHTALAQIRALPEENGRKIPFELINENPLPFLPRLLRAIRTKAIKVSQVNLTLRADWLLQGQEPLREALQLAGEMGVRILAGSVGFESFDDRILSNLNKGLTVETNLKAITVMRQLTEEFPSEWSYARSEGAIHGFIHPTPWDDAETSSNIRKVIHIHGLPNDVLPDYSIPLIIHHASTLGEWIRKVESIEGVTFHREVSTIGWWQLGDRFVL